jgi:hypothetical protein
VALRELPVEVQEVGRDKGGAEMAYGLNCTPLYERGRYRDSTSKQATVAKKGQMVTVLN